MAATWRQDEAKGSGLPESGALWTCGSYAHEESQGVRIVLNATAYQSCISTWVPEDLQLFIFWLSVSLYFYIPWKRKSVIICFERQVLDQASQNRLVTI